MIRLLRFQAIASVALVASAQDRIPAQGDVATQADAPKGVGLLEREHPIAAWDEATGELDDLGLQVDLFYTLDVLGNVDGGVERRTDIIGNVDLLLNADMEKLFGWDGGALCLYALGNHGAISDAVGDLQGVSNIEGPATVKLFEAWVEQELYDGGASIRVGLYDVNSEFDVIPDAALFLNGSQGMGAELGNSGRNGPSTFPVTSLSARVDLRPSASTYARFMVADGVPGRLDDDKRTQVQLGGDDGVLLMGEIGVLNLPVARLPGRLRRFGEAEPVEDEPYGLFGKFALGVWRYTGAFDDFNALDRSGDPLGRNARPGVYALATQRVYYEPADPFQGLSIHARAGLADRRTNAFDGYLGAGFVYRGWISGRDRDEVGVAVAAGQFGDDYQRAASTGQGWEDWEVVTEVTYRARVSRWLSVQPNFQFVAHPGGDPGIPDATVIGLRMLVSF